MTRIKEKTVVTGAHAEAVALLEEMAGCLRLPMDVVQDLARRVTGKPWEELDLPGAEEVADVLAKILDRSLAKQAVHAS